MLTLEKLSAEHKEELAALGNDPIISATSSVDYPCTPDTVQEWIGESSGEPPLRITFVARMNGEIVGAVSLKKIDYQLGNAELSYWIGREFWGRGLARQEAAEAIRFAFEVLKLNSLGAQCLRDNNASSQKVLKSLGFRLDESRPGHDTRLRWAEAFPDDRWEWYGLNRDEWGRASSSG